MKFYFYTIIGIVLFSQPVFAQRENVSLLVQSPDGKNVKLVWFFKSWGKDIMGFDIKRKDGLQDWMKLNSEPILPEISAKKNLEVVESDDLEASRVKAKLFKLLSTHKLTPINNEGYLNMLNKDDKAAKALSAVMERDYDLALMSGFAFVDHTVTKKTNYEYGLFITGTNILLDSVLWNYGQIPDLNAIKEITAKGTTRSNGIQVIWNADLNKIRAGDVAGFNIYREGIRLNPSPIMATNSKDPSEFTWFDKSASGANPNLYSISAESLFGIEGIIKSYTYNPEDHPEEYLKPAVTEINSLGYYFKEGINVKWTFPKGYERFVKGFYVEKDNMPEGYVRVSPLLDTSANSYVDKSASPVSGYIRFRVTSVYNDKTIVPGVEKLYNYFPVTEPPTPQNLKAQAVFSGKKVSVNLTWDPPMAGDSATDHYRVYSTDTLNNVFRLWADKLPVSATKFTYTKLHGSASVTKFYLSAIGKNGVESQLSDTVSVPLASVELPVPESPKVVIENNVATLEWKYPEISDVKGFRVFLDKNNIAGEDKLNRSARQFKTIELDPGVNYEATIRAVSENGVLSESSSPVLIAIPKGHKK